MLRLLPYCSKTTSVSQRQSQTIYQKDVSLRCVEVKPHRFIHAKLYAFRQSHLTKLFVGSANLSRAALLANEGWGNAELMAVEELASKSVDELFLHGLTILKTRPNFPETHPSENWEVTQRKFRIIAARYSAGFLEIIYNSIGQVVQLHVQIDGELIPINGTPKQISTKTSQHFVSRLEISNCPKSIQLRCTLENNETELSEYCWVDNEHNLGITTLERRFDLKAEEAITDRLPLRDSLLALIREFPPHLRQSIGSGSFIDVNNSRDDSKTGPSFLNEDIFWNDDEHSVNNDENQKQPLRKFDDTQIMKFVRHQFEGTNSVTSNHSNNEVSTGVSTTNEDDEEDDRDPETDEISNTRAKKEYKNKRTHQEQRKAFITELRKVSSAVSYESFFTSRSPVRLQRDIIVLALFFRLGLQEHFLFKDEFAEETLNLWSGMFFGSEDNQSSLERHLSSIDPEKVDEFTSALTSPELTASLILWCFPSWGSTEKHTIKFRFSSMLLAEKFPWLITGGVSDEAKVHEALRQFSRVIPGEDAFDTLVAAWKRWRKSAVAFQKLKQELKSFSPTRLSEAVSQKRVERGDLLIQGGKFYVSESECSCNSPTAAKIYSLTENSEHRFRRNRLVPVVGLLNDDNLLNLDPRLRTFLTEFLNEVKANLSEIRLKPRQSTRTQKK